MAIKFLSGQTISGTLTVSGNVQGATFNGLAINTTGTNNVANQIVRTQANGYVNFGWINSVSGNHTGAITRITASNDAYLRYVTPAQFRTGVTDGFYAPSSTVSGVTSVATGNGLTGGTITSTGTLTMSVVILEHFLSQDLHQAQQVLGLIMFLVLLYLWLYLLTQQLMEYFTEKQRQII